MRALVAIAIGFACIVPASARPPDGGGEAPIHASDEISAEQRARIDAQLAENVARLRREGKLDAVPLAPLQSNLAWPLQPVAAYRSPGYHGISNFVDLNPAANALLDYDCGARTYDLVGPPVYNHAGIDIYLWPFSWLMMDQGSIDIVAAAAGTIIGKQDGFDDRSCPNNYSADWNAVYIRHADDTVAWYGHMKLGTPTAKPVGAAVAAGEVLGKVGSSGFSSGPHLHFENHSAVSGYTILEPYMGACRAGASLWASQRPYYDSAINQLSTHSAPPVFPSPNCPNPVDETPNYKSKFLPGDVVYFIAYYRDQRSGQNAAFTVLRPDGSVFQSWNFAMAQPYFSSSYWYWWYTLPVPAPSGVWKFRAVYETRTTEVRFTVGDVIFADGYE